MCSVDYIYNSTFWYKFQCQISGKCKKMVIKSEKEKAKGVKHMKGYVTDKGYMGLVEGCYILFASEREYYDYMED